MSFRSVKGVAVAHTAVLRILLALYLLVKHFVIFFCRFNPHDDLSYSAPASIPFSIHFSGDVAGNFMYISGFLMQTFYGNDEMMKPTQFYLKRMSRIFVVYYIVALLDLPLLHHYYGWRAFQVMLFYNNHFFALSTWRVYWFITDISLAYFAFPFLSPTVARLGKVASIFILSMAFSAHFAVTFAAYYFEWLKSYFFLSWQGSVPFTLMDVWIQSRFPCIQLKFIVGMLAGHMRSPRNQAVTWVIVVVSFLLFPSLIPHEEVIVTQLAVLALLIFDSGKKEGNCVAHYLEKWSDYSYSLFMIHVPTFDYLRHCIPTVIWSNWSCAFALHFSLSISGAIAITEAVEKPMFSFIRNWLFRSQQSSLV